MMSHAGRRIATTAAAAAAVALPIAAAGSAFADTTGVPAADSVAGVGLPDAAGLGGLGQALPLSSLPAVGTANIGDNSPLSGLTSGNGVSGLTDTLTGGTSPVSNLPVAGSTLSGLPVVGGLAGAAQNAAAGDPNAVAAPVQPASAAMQAVQDYAGKHRA